MQEVIEQYNDCKLEEREDPEEWIIKKDEICLCLQIDYGKRDYRNDSFKAAVVHGLPEAYHSEKTLLKDKYQTMEIHEIITVLREEFKELGVNAMVAREGNNLSRVMCFHYGKYGHKLSGCHIKNDGKPDVVPRCN